MSFGDNVLVARDCWIGALEGDGGSSPRIVIGSGAGIGMASSISASLRVEIGANVLLARNVYISDHAHAFLNPEMPIILQGITDAEPVLIGADSWLGQNVCVLPGVKIGCHCVIGANSVVTSSIPDYSVAVGAPARVVKMYDHTSGKWVRTRRLEEKQP